MVEYDLIIIGGGAAGMFAAATAASCHKSVLLLEKGKRLGHKLSITGKGRCNITNNCSVDEVLKNIPRNPRFLYSCMNAFSPSQTIAFFEQNGLAVKTERGNRVFPVSDHASDVVTTLKNVLEKYHVQIVYDGATELIIENGCAVGVVGRKRKYYGKAVVVATGGYSYPLTGSTGDGHEFAVTAGHTIMPCSGSLVPLVVNGTSCRELAGLTLKNVAISLYGGKKKPIYSDFGEALFMSYGLSGPIVLSASAHLPENTECYITLDLKPALSIDKLEARILRDFSMRANDTIYSCLRALLPAQIISLILERSGIFPGKPVNAITKEERKALIVNIKALRFDITGKRVIDEAIITRGGVKVSEINPGTMESKMIQRLYFAGEIIDCDAYTGGFNLQIAWATAHAAAISAVQN